MSGPHPDPLALEAHLEPAAVAELGTGSELTIQASIAVSLKRIADSLTMVTGGDGALNAYFFEQAAYQAGIAFERGRR